MKYYDNLQYSNTRSVILDAISVKCPGLLGSIGNIT